MNWITRQDHHELLALGPHATARVWVGEEDEGRAWREEWQMLVPAVVVNHVVREPGRLLGRWHGQ